MKKLYLTLISFLWISHGWAAEEVFVHAMDTGDERELQEVRMQIEDRGMSIPRAAPTPKAPPTHVPAPQADQSAAPKGSGKMAPQSQVPVAPQPESEVDPPLKAPTLPEGEEELRQSMVTHFGDGKFHVSGDFKDHQEDLVTMNDLSYAIAKTETALMQGDTERAIEQAAKRERLIKQLEEAGWEIRIFEGQSGKKNKVDDKVGFVAYNKETNKMAVIFHGSQNGADWETNFDFVKRKARDEGIDLDGRYHRGFLQKYASAKASMIEAIKYFTDTLSKSTLLNMLTFVSGHSQGGGLASIALGDLAINVMKQIIGKDFSNAADNRLYLWSLSGARVADREAADQLNREVGVHNMIRQNPLHDPVPNLAPGMTFSKILSKIPIFGETLADEYAGYASIGTLALAPDFETFADKEFWAAAKSWIERTIEDARTSARESLKGKSLKEKASVLKALWRSFRGGVTVLLAPLHQGGVLEGDGGAFAPNIVNRDFERMLKDGWDHKRKSAHGRGEEYEWEDPYGSETESEAPELEEFEPENPVVVVVKQAAETVVETVKDAGKTVVETGKKAGKAIVKITKKLKFW